MKTLIACLLFILHGMAAAQTFFYSQWTTTTGTTVANGVTVGIQAAVSYSTNTPNTSSKTFDLYYPNARGNASTLGPMIVYIHGGGMSSGTSYFNWFNSTANPVGPAALVAAYGWNLYMANYTLAVNTAATQHPEQEQNIDCMLRSLVHNRGTAGFPGNGHIFLWGSSAGGLLAEYVKLKGPLATANCEWTDTYTIDGVFNNSGWYDVPANAADTSITNAASDLTFAQNWVPCTTTCQGALPIAVSPVNFAVAGKGRSMFFAGATDGWLRPSNQSASMVAAYATAGQTVPYLLSPSCGHLCDEQTGGLTGLVQTAAAAFINNTRSSSSAGGTSIAGGSW